MNKSAIFIVAAMALGALWFITMERRAPAGSTAAVERAVLPAASPATAERAIDADTGTRARASAGIGAVAKPEAFMNLAKGVQEYCLDQYDLAPCMHYAVKCGKQCTSLLPRSLVDRMFADYNKYLLTQGDKPLRPLRKPAFVSPVKAAPIKSSLKSGSI